MKAFFSFLVLFSLTMFAQDMNKCIIDTTTNKAMLIGPTSLEAFKDTAFANWYNTEYESYKIDTTVLAGMEKDFTLIEVKVVMGTWCSDSRREVPRLIKILTHLDFPLNKLTIINVDRHKDDGRGLVKDLDIEKIPTIIVYKDGFEMGRIIETPNESLEKDLVKFVNSEI